MISSSDIHTLVAWGGCFIWIILAYIGAAQPRVTNRVWYWHSLIAGLDEIPEHFYAQVYQRLQTGIQNR